MKFVPFRLIFFSVFFTLIALFSGCAKYSARPLDRLVKVDSVYTDKNGNDGDAQKRISMSYKIFNKGDCIKSLDRDVIAKGYQPIQISVRNDSDRYIRLCKSNIDMPLVSAGEVGRRVHTSTLTRVIGYGVAGLFLWPFLIPAAVDGMKSEQANQRLDIDFADKELSDQIIAPYSSANGLIFVRKEDFDPDFAISLVDIERKVRFVLNSSNDYLNI